MEEKLQRIQEEAAKQIKESDSLEKLNEVRVAFLGKKGELTAVLKGMKDVAPEDRPKVGQWVNEARGKIPFLPKRWRQDTDILIPSLWRK